MKTVENKIKIKEQQMVECEGRIKIENAQKQIKHPSCGRRRLCSFPVIIITWSCQKWSIIQSQGEKENPTYSKKKES